MWQKWLHQEDLPQLQEQEQVWRQGFKAWQFQSQNGNHGNGNGSKWAAPKDGEPAEEEVVG